MLADGHPWNYGRFLNSVRRDWDAHDRTCQSLRHAWLGYRGGVTALGDIGDCRDYGTSFFWDGLTWVNWDDEDAEEELRYCACCLRKRELNGKLAD